jgi:predicted  nucleic acid-binding Zn-ribbon protein
VRTFLEYVAGDGTHSAFAIVCRLHERARKLGVESLLFEAAAATRHVESAQFLRTVERDPAADPAIEDLLRRTGAHGIVDEMTAHRRIRRNIAEANEASDAREGAIRQEGEHRLAAIREAAAATEAQLQAGHANADKHFVIALSAVEQTRHVIALEQHLRRLAELAARVPSVRNELTLLQQTLNRLADLHNELVQEINHAYAEVQSMERQVEAHDAAIRDHHSRMQRLRGDLERARGDEERIQRRLRQLAAEHPSDPNAVEALRRRIRDAEAELNSCGSRIRTAAADIDSRQRAIRGLRAAITDLQSRVSRAEASIAALSEDIDRNRFQHREVRARTDVQEAIFHQLLRDIDAVQRDITATENALHETHRALDRRVAELEARRTHYAELQRDHQLASAQAVRAADRERQRFIDLSGVIAELESSTAQLLATIAANRQQTAEEVAGIDAAARIAEQQRRGMQRLRQSMQLNVDLLMSIVKAVVAPGPEARQVLVKMEGAA